MSIVSKWRSIDSYNRFLILFPFWLLALFGTLYWGRFWSYSPIGEMLDSSIRSVIMYILDALVSQPIRGFDIIMNPKYHIIITPECNGLIPYLMLLAAVVAYGCNLSRKIFWAIASFVALFIANIFRLWAVIVVVDKFGADSFYYVHDVGGNILLVTIGSALFLGYIRGCKI